jgi:hypothetical protein
VSLNGRKLASHHHFLNEARLSAIAVSLYLASLLVSIPPPPPGAPEYPKLLVLDDVLIGLDMANRMPVLEILKKHFADWQILLLTYDKVWFDIVRLQTQDTKEWRYSELFRQTSPEGVEVPVYKDEGEGWPAFIARAKQHLQGNDERAAVAYARAAFEGRVKNYCESKSLPVRYSSDPRKMESEWFWKAIKDKAAADGKTADYQQLFRDIETHRKIILNPLSHADPVSVTRTEIEAAIKVVEALASLQ